MRTNTAATRGLLVILSLVAMLLVPLAQPASAADSSRERHFLELVNAERTARGKAALKVNTQLVSVARSWSDVMDRDSKLKHNPNLADQVTETWYRLGENVGVGYSVSSLHQAFMDSSGHRANVLGDYDQVGIGVTMDGRRIWVTFNFMKGPKSSNTKTVSSGNYWPFRDVAPTATHGWNIDAIRVAGITNGCGSASEYCPDRNVTRAEMAAFIQRALDLPDAKESFADVPNGSWFAPAVGALAKDDITQGCGGGNYCPDRNVTRAEMAAFIQRALDLPDRSESFSDVPNGSWYAPAVGAMQAAGITNGCGSGEYCPDRPVTRAEMASFLSRALDL